MINARPRSGVIAHRSQLRRGPIYRVALDTATATAIGDAIEAADADHWTRRVIERDQTTP